MAHAPDIFMNLQHPNYSSNFENLLPDTQAFDIYLVVSILYDLIRFDSIRFLGLTSDVLLSESKSVFLSPRRLHMSGSDRANLSPKCQNSMIVPGRLCVYVMWGRQGVVG